MNRAVGVAEAGNHMMVGVGDGWVAVAGMGSGAGVSARGKQAEKTDITSPRSMKQAVRFMEEMGGYRTMKNARVAF